MGTCQSAEDVTETQKNTLSIIYTTGAALSLIGMLVNYLFYFLGFIFIV
jgi:hypothetical protein